MTYEVTTGQGKVAHSWAVTCLCEEGLRLGAGLAWILEKIGRRAGRCQIVGRMTELGSNPGQLAPLPQLGLLSLEQTQMVRPSKVGTGSFHPLCQPPPLLPRLLYISSLLFACLLDFHFLQKSVIMTAKVWRYKSVWHA